MKIQVSLIVSPAKGGLARLFSPKGRMTKATLEINTDQQVVMVEGTDPLVSGIKHELRFDQIAKIESKGPLMLDIHPKEGNPIMLKNVDEVAAALDMLGEHVTDNTNELIRRRIDKFEARTKKVEKTLGLDK